MLRRKSELIDLGIKSPHFKNNTREGSRVLKLGHLTGHLPNECTEKFTVFKTQQKRIMNESQTRSVQGNKKKRRTISLYKMKICKKVMPI